MAALVSVNDYEKLAKEKLPKNAWDYYSSGATNQQSLINNFTAYQK